MVTPSWKPSQVATLIRTVKQLDPIYNSKNKLYRNTEYLDELWSDIDIELKQPPGASKEKWINLRNTFRNEYRISQRSGQQHKPAWRHFDEMLFLTKHLRKLSPTNSLEHCIQMALLKQKESANKSSMEDSSSTNNVENLEIVLDNESEEIIYLEEVSSDGNNVYDIANVENDDNVDHSSQKDEILFDKSLITEQEDNNLLDDIVYKNEIVENYRNQDFENDDNKIKALGTASGIGKKRIKTESSNIDSSDDCKNFIKKRRQDNQSKLKTESEEEINQSEPTIKLNSPSTNNPIAMSHHNATECTCKTDPDAMFLQSLLPEVKSMPLKSKGIFKIKIQQIIQNILYPDDD